MKRKKCKQNMRKISQDVVYGFMQKMKCLQNGPLQFNSRTVVVNIMPFLSPKRNFVYKRYRKFCVLKRVVVLLYAQIIQF